MSETKNKPGELSGGELTIDPTENVKALTEAANQRQDDLREITKELFHAEIQVLDVTISGLEKRMILRAEHAKEIRQIESEHAKEIRRTETERVNAIRQVDVLAGNTAADRALVAIQTLASQTTAERETLRNLVTTTAATVAAQTGQEFARIHEEISALQKSSYEGAGKGTGAKNLWGMLAGGVALLVTLFMAALTVGGIVVGIAYAIRN